MDKYIKMMLIKLNLKYQSANLVIFMNYDDEKQYIKKKYRLTIKHLVKENNNDEYTMDTFTNDYFRQKDLIEEMASWL